MIRWDSFDGTFDADARDALRHGIQRIFNLHEFSGRRECSKREAVSVCHEREREDKELRKMQFRTVLRVPRPVSLTVTLSDFCKCIALRELFSYISAKRGC